MDPSRRILSDLICYMKYAKYLPGEKRRETWAELVNRNKEMHLRRFPFLSSEINEAYQLVYEKKVIPSARTLQFAGKPIEINPARAYNCCGTAIDHPDVFSEVMFLLLTGCGVGYSVQKSDVAKLPEVKGALKRRRRFLVNDSIEGWADAVKVLMRAHFEGRSTPDFDFRDIRPKGAPLLTSGGRAPGPQPLKDCLHNIEKVLTSKERGEQLTPLECHDILCHIADTVLSGGIRRAACLALFSLEDQEMLSCKTGNWMELNPQRGRANDSVVLIRHRVRKKDFTRIWEIIRHGGNGEPGIFFSNDKEMSCNPCQPASAQILTPDGIKTIGEVKPGDVIWSGKQWTTVIAKKDNGIKPVYQYSTTAGVFIGTSNHRIIQHGMKVEAKDAEAIDTSQGPLPGQQRHSWSIQDTMDGLVLGDGTIHKASNNLIGLCIGRNDQDYFESEISPLLGRHRPGIGPLFYEVWTGIRKSELPKTFRRRVPSRYMHATTLVKTSFLRGLYTANGSICGGRITLKSSSIGLIRDIQVMLSSIGIRSYLTTNREHPVKFRNGTYLCKESYGLNITTDRKKFRDLIGFIQESRQQRLEEICSKNRRKKDPKETYKITDRQYLGDEQVFNITVEAAEHTYWTGGLLVSNCGEVSLRNHSFCNLTTINVSDSSTQEEINLRAKVAAFISTLQASYTDFHYLRGVWQRNTERDALLGVSLCGIAGCSSISQLNLEEAAEIVKKTNQETAEALGIKPAARTTCVKPDGTTSLLLGSSAGIHPWYDKFYKRRIRVLKNEAIYKYMKKKMPELVEDEFFSPRTQAIITLPIKAPEGAILKDEPAIDLLERIKKVNTEWIRTGHTSGANTHSISATVHIKEDEWDTVGEWMWKNREYYNGITVLPYDNTTYPQMPMESCSEEEYNNLLSQVKDIDLREVSEEEDFTEPTQEWACSGDKCSLI